MEQLSPRILETVFAKAASPAPAAAPPEMADPLEDAHDARARQRFILDDTGFDEVPAKYRKFYRKWKGAGDRLAPNEVICPVCKVVIRSTRELRPGDRVYCMPCMARLVVARADDGTLEARSIY